MINKSILFTIVFLLTNTILNSQTAYDKLYFKNGNTMLGFLLNDRSDNYLVRDLEGNILTYSPDEVESITHKKQRYINFTGAGLIYGSALNEKPITLSVISEHNIQFYNYFAAGGLIGTELLNELTIPLGVNLKIYLPTRKRTWYVNGSTGYSFSVEKPQTYYEEMKGKGGTLAMIELGTMIPLNYHNSLFASLGYRYNELNYTYEDWWRGKTERTYYYNRISLRFGLSLY